MLVIFFALFTISFSKLISRKEPRFCHEVPSKFVKKDQTPWLVVFLVIEYFNDFKESDRSAMPEMLESKKSKLAKLTLQLIIELFRVRTHMFGNTFARRFGIDH